MLAVIGGSGFYHLEGAARTEYDIDTPYGKPSAPIVKINNDGAEVLFLSRHGAGHRFLPSEINYRANIWALKHIGARQIISISACGSLQESIRPGDFIIPSQYFDHTRGQRAHTFFGDGLVAHISSAQAVCPSLAAALATACVQHGFTVHSNKTYACVEGPRLGTRAESFFLRNALADIVGMTNIPEVFLAIEAQLCYATLAVCTDYDCWMDDPAHHATVETIIARFGKTIAHAREVVTSLIAEPPPINDEHRCRTAAAIMTAPSDRTVAHQKLLEVLLA